MQFQLRTGPRVWLFDNNQRTGEVATETAGVPPRLRPLLPSRALEVTGSSKLPGHSEIQLQVGDVFLDPVLVGVGTELPASFGLEAVERSGRVTRCGMQRGEILGAPHRQSLSRAAQPSQTLSAWPGQVTPQRHRCSIFDKPRRAGPSTMAPLACLCLWVLTPAPTPNPPSPQRQAGRLALTRRQAWSTGRWSHNSRL